MEKYSKAVSEMYSQFEKREPHPLEKREPHPLEKYVGRLAKCCGVELEVVGYQCDADNAWLLIADGTKIGGWARELLVPRDVVFKNCERYFYVGIDDLIYKEL